MDEKGLQLNVEKSKIMRCRKRGGGRWKRVVWRWKGKAIEGVPISGVYGDDEWGAGGTRKG